MYLVFNVFVLKNKIKHKKYENGFLDFKFSANKRRHSLNSLTLLFLDIIREKTKKQKKMKRIYY